MNGTAGQLRDQIDQLIWQADFEQLMDICKPALKDARSRHDLETEAMALLGWSQARKYLGRFAEARILCNGALDFSRQANAADIEILALLASASLYVMGNYQAHEAETDARLALNIAHEINDERNVAAALMSIGTALHVQGDSGRALGFVREAFEVARDLSDHEIQAFALTVMGHIFLQAGNSETALQSYRDALKISQTHELSLLEGELIGNMGMILARSERYASEGIQMLERSLDIARDMHCPPREFNALYALGMTYQQKAQYENALTCYESMLNIAQLLDSPAYESTAFFNFAMLSYESKQYPEAVFNLEQALTIVRKTMNPYREAMMETWLGTVKSQQQDYEGAITHYTNARNIYLALDDNQKAMQLLQTIVVTYVRRFFVGILHMIGFAPHEDE